MTNNAFILQRISNFAGTEIDPCSDPQVSKVLRDKFNIYLPQRRSMTESLKAVANDHEIIQLIIKYRSTTLN